MSALLNTPSIFSHMTQMPAQHPPHRQSPPRMVGRKRKADHDGDSSMGRDRSRSPDDHDYDEHMNSSPSHSPSMESRTLRSIKRPRNTVTGRPLPLNRMMETVDMATLKNMLRELCEKHPQMEQEIMAIAPRPSVQSAIQVLQSYENNLQASFPYGGNRQNDYAYYRVKTSLVELLNALSDYTPHFLPPNETQSGNSFNYLDQATEIIHRLPEWSTAMHNHHKQIAYEEITKAWVLVIKEASKKGNGVGIQYNGWDTKLAKHNENSGGRMEAAINEIRDSLPGADSGRPRFNGSMGFQMSTSSGVSVRSW